MVLDRVHRTPRVAAVDEKLILRDVGRAGSVELHVGGVVLNHLGWAAALGLRTGIFGRQADDEHGRILRAAMDRLGIERHLELGGSATSVAEIFVDDAGGRTAYVAPGATAETTAEHIARDHAGFIRSAARVSTEVSLLPLAATLEVLQQARRFAVPTAVDLDVPPAEALAGLGDESQLDAVLRHADLLKPSKSAALELVPEAGSDALEIARALRARYRSWAVVLTDGAAGCAIAAEDFEGRVPARATVALDTTGAGDAFLGGLLAGLHHRLGWRAAAQLANACGAACVEKLGGFPEDAEGARKRVLELYSGPALPLTPLQAPLPPPRPGVAEALASFEVVREELSRLQARLDPEALERALELLRSAQRAGGRVHVTGIGKPEHIARYAASLLASTGTPATFLHATEAVHGSAGQVVAGDVVIAVSNSGETPEIREVVEAVRRMQARVVAVTGCLSSWLARSAEVALDAGVSQEGGPLGLAPRASAVAQLLVLAALAAGLERESGFSKADYGLRHPGGTLGESSRR